MVSPARKREAVAHLGAVLRVSGRRACQVITQPRSTQRCRPLQPALDAALDAALAAALLRRSGIEINLKRVQRVWRQEGLKVPRRQHKRQRLGTSENGSQRLSGQSPGHVWSYDFTFDQTEDGRRLKWLPICDEFSRELVALEVERRMEAKDVIRILEAAIEAKGGPQEFLRSDNGPEFIAKAVQDWIRRKGFKTLYIKPGSPWQNACCGSFRALSI